MIDLISPQAKVYDCNPRIGELDHVAAVDGDQVIVPRLASVLVAAASVSPDGV